MLTDVVIANKSYTRMNVTAGKAVDNIALMVMKQDCPDFLLPLKTLEIDGELELRYELSDGIRLCYSNLKMGKREFTELLKNMLTPYKICNDWFLDYHNILMDANYIMVGKNGMSVRYIYIPVAECAHSDGAIMDFFCDLILKAEIEDDPRYAMTLLRLLKSDNGNLITLLDYLSHEQETGMKTAEAGNGGSDFGGTGNVPSGFGGTGNGGSGFGSAGSGGSGFGSAGSGGSGFSSAGNGASGFGSVGNGGSGFGSAGSGGSGFGSAGNGTSGFGGTGNGTSGPGSAGSTDGSGNGTAGSGGASRPGQMPKEFGKQDMEGKLMGSLFGDDEEEDQPRKKKKEEKQPKPAKEPKEKKDKKDKKEKKEGGLFGFKAKSEKQQSSGGQMNQAAAAGAPEAYAGNNNNFAQNGWQAPTNNSYGGGDATEVDGDEEVYDSSVLRLSLEDGAGFRCPKFIEINLQKGYATIGRVDKSGQGQADFNFDASLSFVSRIHLRIERAGDQWQIIDLGSKNGTFLNGEALVPNMAYPLRPNDRIMISAKNRLIYRVC